MGGLAPTLGDRLWDGVCSQAVLLALVVPYSPHSLPEHSLKKQQEAAVLWPHHLGYWTEA